MKGVLKNKDGKWVVEYYYMRTSSHATHPNLTELPLHPEDITQIKKDSLIFGDIKYLNI